MIIFWSISNFFWSGQSKWVNVWYTSATIISLWTLFWWSFLLLFVLKRSCSLKSSVTICSYFDCCLLIFPLKVCLWKLFFLCGAYLEHFTIKLKHFCLINEILFGTKNHIRNVDVESESLLPIIKKIKACAGNIIIIFTICRCCLKNIQQVK